MKQVETGGGRFWRGQTQKQTGYNKQREKDREKEKDKQKGGEGNVRH